MITRRRIGWSFASVILVGGAITLLLLAGSTLRGPAQPAAGPQLTLTVKPEKTQLLLGEPLKVLLTVQNTTTREITGIFPLDYKFLLTNFQVDLSSDGGQTTQPYISPLMIRGRTIFVTPPPPVTLPPQGTVEGSFFISFNTETKDFAFPKAGRFWFRIKVWVVVDFGEPTEKGELLESSWVAIEVVEPGQEQDKKALQFIREKKLERFLTPEAPFAELEVGEDLNEIVKQLKAFLEQFPDSTYAPYVRLGLEAICDELWKKLPACQG